MSDQEERPPIYQLDVTAASEIVEILEKIEEHYSRKDHRVYIGDATITLWFDPYRRVHTLSVQYGSGRSNSVYLSTRQPYLTERTAALWLDVAKMSGPVKAFSYEKTLSDDDRTALLNAFASLFIMVDSGLTKRAFSI